MMIEFLDPAIGQVLRALRRRLPARDAGDLRGGDASALRAEHLEEVMREEVYVRVADGEIAPRRLHS